MTLEQMKFLDKYGGWVLCVLLAGFNRIRNVVSSCGSPAEVPDMPEMLVVKFWGMGSTVLCTPVLGAIKARYPECRLTFFTLSRNRETVDLFPAVDRVVTLDIDNGVKLFVSSLVGAMRELRGKRIDIAFDLEFFTRFSAIVVYLTGAVNRVGFRAWEKWRGDLQTVGVPFNRYWHVTRNFCNLAGAMGIPVPAAPDLMKPEISSEEQFKADEIMRTEGLLSGRFMCMNPNCGEIALTRKWGSEKFAQLARIVLDHSDDVKIVFIGSPGESEFVRSVVSGISDDRIIDLSGRLSVAGLAHLLGRSMLLITNDSGPLHLACAMGTRTISFFGPETPVLYGPGGQEHTVFFRNIDCSPCINVHEDKSFRCMRKSSLCLEGITVDEVWLAVKNLLDGVSHK
ncbi:MAG: glycosyltransferase family 9 protein [Kiritimatiellae bacterium]|nr:glycosyltransferase family 9 protein [Kiritimatiellia bacterium]